MRSSHCSLPLTMPSPQNCSIWQLAEQVFQPPVLFAVPRSQDSYGLSVSPSPQYGPRWQSGVQRPYPPSLMPSSQVSPSSMTPLPQRSSQVSVQLGPPSHCSPHSSWTVPSPQRAASWQSAVQEPYEPSLTPSSQVSPL